MLSNKLWKALVKKVVGYYDTAEIGYDTVLYINSSDLYVVLDYTPIGWTPVRIDGDEYFFRVPRQVWCPVLSSFGLNTPHYSKYTSNRKRSWKRRSYRNRINYYA